MNKQKIKFLALSFYFFTLWFPNLFAQSHGATDLVDFVNPLMGTDSKPSLSNGNTYPAVGVPWGMNMWTPQTGKMGY